MSEPPRLKLQFHILVFSSNHSVMEKTLNSRDGFKHLEATKIQIVKTSKVRKNAPVFCTNGLRVKANVKV